jgi:hypothetical protein
MLSHHPSHFAPTHRGHRFVHRLVLGLVEASAASVFLGAVIHHVYTLNFRPLAAFILPVLVMMFGFTSLLYMRGRSLRRGKDQLRTMFAAERSMQAAVWYFMGIALGIGMYGLLQLVPLDFDPNRPTLNGLWLLGFVAPYAIMQIGFALFMRAAWVIAPQFLRPVTPFEFWRRIRNDPQEI